MGRRSFRSLGRAEALRGVYWHVQIVEEQYLERNLRSDEASAGVKDKPSLIAVRTVIGYGSPKAGTKQGAWRALGAEAVKQTKKKPWLAPRTRRSYVPEDAAKNWGAGSGSGAKVESDWNALFASYRKLSGGGCGVRTRAGGSP